MPEIPHPGHMPYHYNHPLPATAAVFDLANQAGRKILRNPRNWLEIRYTYSGIPCDNDALPDEFNYYVPDTKFSLCDVSAASSTMMPDYGIRLHLRDRQIPARNIILVQTGSTGRLKGLFSIEDDFPLLERESRSRPVIPTEVVRKLLVSQLRSPEPKHLGMDVQELCFEIGHYATKYVRINHTAEVELGSGTVIHVEEDVVEPTASPQRGKHTQQRHIDMGLWVTAKPSAAIRNLGRDVLQHTYTMFDAQNYASSHNTLNFQLDADAAEDRSELERYARQQVSNPREIVRRFTSRLQTYIRTPGD